jgi:integration host factor subunit alpha
VAQKTLTRSDLILQFSRQLLIPQNQASFLIEAIIQQIFSALNEDSSLKISSFGTFLVHKKRQRVGRNPKTGTEALITPRKSVSFRTSQILKARINRRMKREKIS